MTHFFIARTTKHPQRATVSGEEEGMVPQLSGRGRANPGHLHSHHNVSCSRPQVTSGKVYICFDTCHPGSCTRPTWTRWRSAWTRAWTRLTGPVRSGRSSLTAALPRWTLVILTNLPKTYTNCAGGHLQGPHQQGQRHLLQQGGEAPGQHCKCWGWHNSQSFGWSCLSQLFELPTSEPWTMERYRASYFTLLLWFVCKRIANSTFLC